MSEVSRLEPRFVELIAQEINCRPGQVQAAADLFAEGATVPFVARYRKEVTGGLIDEQLENLHKRRTYFIEFMERRDSILESIQEQGKLSDELEALIRSVDTKQHLEDLYLPYKRKRRTRAQIAKERGLELLADSLLEEAAKGGVAATLAQDFVDEEKQVADTDAALAGARDILAERLSENAEQREILRRKMNNESELKVKVLTGKEEEGKVYQDYFDYDERAGEIPSHRLLAILRGEREGFLVSDLSIDDELEINRLTTTWEVPLNSSCGEQIMQATTDGYKRLLRPSITNEIRGNMRERAEAKAISVFRENLEALLMQAPLGQIAVMGLDPGLRTGCKLAVTDGTGQVKATDVIYAIPPGARPDEARRTILRLVDAHDIRAVAIGNGTGSRETELFVRKVMKEAKRTSVIVAIVPETGASVYSASAIAREELPELDVSLRGAVSIARRIQDPLAELVKIEPKSMGVGQYQHDVNQKALAAELDLAVEGVVNKVGVELNTASHALLRRVSGVSERIAKAIVAHREKLGVFSERSQLLKVRGFGPKTYQLAAGFLRVHGAKNPLDATAVHPESYHIVETIAKELSVSLDDLVGNPSLAAKIDVAKFTNEDEGVGTFTLEDIRKELAQPGRDPRPEYVAPAWRDDVQSIDDLEEGMILEGRVSNVTNFGAFVDIGVKRDGLVHLSELSNKWVDDPLEVIKVGEIVKVKVIEVEKGRGRISLSIKALQEDASQTANRRSEAAARRSGGGGNRSGGGGGRNQRSGGGNRRGGNQRGGNQRGNTRGSGAGGAVTVADLMKKFGK